MLKDRVNLEFLVSFVAEARCEGEVFSKVMDGEIADVKFDAITPVLCDCCRINCCYANCRLDEYSITWNKDFFLNFL